MKVTSEELERCETLLTVEIERKQEQDLLQKAAKRIAREVKIPGFRPGKAPYNVVVRRFGLDTVQQEALEHSADKLIQDALDEQKLIPYARVSLENIEWNPLTIKVKVPTRPKVELSDYHNLRLDFEPVEVTDEDIQETLQDIQEQHATWVPVERAAELDDLVDMAVVEKDGDEVISERESVEYVLDPPEEHEGHNHPDLTTPLLGLSAGDEKTFTLTYPDDFDNERYAGKEITFEVKVSSVKEKELDPLDDEFASSYSDFETLDELEADIRKHLQEQREQDQTRELGNQALEKIIEEATIEWPQAFEDESVEQEVQRFERQMRAYGLTLESYLQMQNKSREEFAEELREQVVEQLERSLALGKVVDLEKLQVGESEILERAKLIADYSGGGEQIWRNIIASPAQQEAVSNELLADKAIELLAAIAKGEDPQPLAEQSGEGTLAEETPEAEVEEAPEAEAEVEESAADAVVETEDLEPEKEEE